MALLESRCESFHILRFFLLELAVEFTMSVVVAWIRPQAADFGLIGIIGNKAVLRAIVLVFFVSFFIFVDFGFDIDERVEPRFTALSLWLRAGWSVKFLLAPIE